MRVAAAILAAGTSSRLGRAKQLLPIEPRSQHAGSHDTLLGHALHVALASPCAPVGVVLGAHKEEIQVSVLPRFPGVEVIANPSFAEGIAASIRAAARWASDLAVSPDGLLLLLCDQPRLDAAHLGRLVARFAASSGERPVGSTYAGSIGVPAVFPRA